MNWQEFGHTKSYWKLSSVYVACGDFNPSSQCTAAKECQDKNVAIARQSFCQLSMFDSIDRSAYQQQCLE